MQLKICKNVQKCANRNVQKYAQICNEKYALNMQIYAEICKKYMR